MMNLQQNESLLPKLQKDLEDKWAEIGTESWELLPGGRENKEKQKLYQDNTKWKVLKTCSRALQGGNAATWEGGICPVCGEVLPKYGVQLHHVNPESYFHETLRDVRLIHTSCHCKIETIKWVPPSQKACAEQFNQSTPATEEQMRTNHTTPTTIDELSADMIVAVAKKFDELEDGKTIHPQDIDNAALSVIPSPADRTKSHEKLAQYAGRILCHLGIIYHVSRNLPPTYRKTDQVKLALNRDVALALRMIWNKYATAKVADKNVYPDACREMVALGFSGKTTRDTWAHNRTLAQLSSLDPDDAVTLAKRKAIAEKKALDKQSKAKQSAGSQGAAEPVKVATVVSTVVESEGKPFVAPAWLDKQMNAAADKLAAEQRARLAECGWTREQIQQEVERRAASKLFG